MVDDPDSERRKNSAERRKNPARKRDRRLTATEAARQEGAKGQLGKSPGKAHSDEQADSSDPNTRKR